MVAKLDQTQVIFPHIFHIFQCPKWLILMVFAICLVRQIVTYSLQCFQTFLIPDLFPISISFSCFPHLQKCTDSFLLSKADKCNKLCGPLKKVTTTISKGKAQPTDFIFMMIWQLQGHDVPQGERSVCIAILLYEWMWIHTV